MDNSVETPSQTSTPFPLDSEVIWTFQHGGQIRFVPGVVRGFRTLPAVVDRRGRVTTPSRRQVEIAVPIAHNRKKRFWAEVGALKLSTEFVILQYQQFHKQPVEQAV